MSGGTVIALACKIIIMGKQSSLGPIDPQLNGIPIFGLLDEVEKAKKEIEENPKRISFWHPILSQFTPALITQAENLKSFSIDKSKSDLTCGMFAENPVDQTKINEIISHFTDNTKTRFHSKHISAQECKDYGLKIMMMEDDQELQDNILSIHHCYTLTFSSTPAVKIIENHLEDAMILQIVPPKT
jgi:ClpP class serine protease